MQQRKWFPADVPMAISGLWVGLSPRPCSGKDGSLDKGLINHKTRDIRARRKRTAFLFVSLLISRDTQRLDKKLHKRLKHRQDVQGSLSLHDNGHLLILSLKGLSVSSIWHSR